MTQKHVGGFGFASRSSEGEYSVVLSQFLHTQCNHNKAHWHWRPAKLLDASFWPDSHWVSLSSGSGDSRLVDKTSACCRVAVAFVSRAFLPCGWVKYLLFVGTQAVPSCMFCWGHKTTARSILRFPWGGPVSGRQPFLSLCSPQGLFPLLLFCPKGVWEMMRLRGLWILGETRPAAGLDF